PTTPWRTACWRGARSPPPSTPCRPPRGPALRPPAAAPPPQPGAEPNVRAPRAPVPARRLHRPARLHRHPRLQRGGDPAGIGAGARGEAAPLRLELRDPAVRERIARPH